MMRDNYEEYEADFGRARGLGIAVHNGMLHDGSGTHAVVVTGIDGAP